MSIRPLSLELQKKAERELNEIPSSMEDCIIHLREWLNQQQHLKAVRATDQWLVAYLRGCKYNLQRTKQKLELHYTLRTILPEYYEDRDPYSDENQEVLQMGAVLPLPHTQGPAEPRVVLIRTNVIDPEVHSMTLVSKVGAMLVDFQLLEDDNFVIGGQVVIVDLTGFTMKHVAQTTFTLMKQIVACYQRSYPTRLQQLIFINDSKFIQNLLEGMKHLTSQKIFKRVKFIQAANLTNLISPKVLPKEYGGELTSLAEVTESWKVKIESYRNWFLEEAMYRSNESLRIGDARTIENSFGVEGSFRKLNID